MGLGPKDLINDLETFGLFFETMAVRNLRVYGDALGGTVYHYRDKNNLECDAVLHLENGNYGLIEIKLGGEDDIEKGATVLKQLAEKIDTTRMKNPSFMMVLVGLGRYAYRREDGVYVVPIGCLKIAGDDIQIMMSFRPDLARAEQGTFKLIVRISNLIRSKNRLQAVLVKRLIVRHKRHFSVLDIWEVLMHFFYRF